MNILLAVKHHELAIAQATLLVEILKDVQTTEPARLTHGTAAGDERKLRGIPCQAKGVGSTQPGTDPLRELIRKETLRERRQTG